MVPPLTAWARRRLPCCVRVRSLQVTCEQEAHQSDQRNRDTPVDPLHPGYEPQQHYADVGSPLDHEIRPTPVSACWRAFEQVGPSAHVSLELMPRSPTAGERPCVVTAAPAVLQVQPFASSVITLSCQWRWGVARSAE